MPGKNEWLGVVYCDNKSMYEELLYRKKTTYTLYAATASHCNDYVQSHKRPGAFLHCGLICCYQFSVPRFRTVAYGKYCLTYLGPVIWSILDISIRSSESFDTFKKRINPRTYTQSHTRSGTRRVDVTSPGSFWYVAVFPNYFTFSGKAYDLPNKMRYILSVVALLGARNVINNGRHLGFYQE